MHKILIAALLVITQASFASATDEAIADKDAIILSPKVFVFSGNTQFKLLKNIPKDIGNGIIASLSWTGNTGDQRAKIEIVNIAYNEDKGSVVFETKQWLPYTLSGEVVSLPVVLKNAKLKLP
tara:strand:- start:41 stop:409 length:369 start_codon:yes stop_codon:yes gene_type:complete